VVRVAAETGFASRVAIWAMNNTISSAPTAAPNVRVKLHLSEIGSIENRLRRGKHDTDPPCTVNTLTSSNLTNSRGGAFGEVADKRETGMTDMSLR
jgi:hypothetical protein